MEICQIFSKILYGGENMEHNYPRFTLRISTTLHEKLQCTADYNARSKNKEIEIAIKRYITDFERLHGEIKTKS